MEGTIDLTPVVVAGIGLLSTIITAILAPLLMSKLSAEKRSELAYWVDVAVDAAWQEHKSESGEYRKKCAQDFLASKGYKVDTDVVDKMIESSVLRLKASLSDKPKV